MSTQKNVHCGIDSGGVAAAADRLVPVLESFLPAPREVNIVYRPKRRPQRKLKSFVDYLLGELSAPAA